MVIVLVANDNDDVLGDMVYKCLDVWPYVQLSP